MSEMQRTMSEQQPAIQSFTPRFDIKEEKDAYHLDGEMPGIAQKDIEIEFSDERTLTVKGRSERYEEKGERPEQLEAPAAAQSGEGKSESTEVATQNNETSVTKAKEQGGPTYWMSERSIGEFKRSFSFPQNVDQEGVKASLKNGVLSIVVPKARKVKAGKKVTIESSE